MAEIIKDETKGPSKGRFQIDDKNKSMIYGGIVATAILGCVFGVSSMIASSVEDTKKEDLMKKFTTAAEYKQLQKIKDSANARYIEATYKEDLKNVKRLPNGPF